MLKMCLKFFSLCVCAHMYMCICRYVFTCVCAFESRGQHKVSSSNNYLPYNFKQGLSLNLKLISLARTASQQVPEILCLHLPSAGITGTAYYHVTHSTWMLEPELILMCAQKVLYPQNHFHGPLEHIALNQH